MSWTFKFSLLTAVLLLPLSLALAGSGSSGCVKWESEARFVGMGYNHLVHLESRCKVKMTCDVSTDVNPEVTTVELAPKAKKTVTTFVGSPAREFSAKISCKESSSS